jgi:SET domain-containing protein
MRTGSACISYINSTVWATLRKSPIHNIGVFAIRDIPKGTRITDNDSYTGKYVLNMLRPDELNEIQPEIRKLILDRTAYSSGDDKFPFYSPNCDAVLQAWMNHSETPNTTGIETLRDIKKDEELTEDYKSLLEGAIHPVSLKHFGFLDKKSQGGTRRTKRKTRQK